MVFLGTVQHLESPQTDHTVEESLKSTQLQLMKEYIWLFQPKACHLSQWKINIISLNTLELDKHKYSFIRKQRNTQDDLPLDQECLSHLENLANPKGNSMFSVYLMLRGLETALNYLFLTVKYFRSFHFVLKHFYPIGQP